MSYHLKPIPKGKLGEFSKIEEEFLEAKDGVEQNCKLLILCELADLLGAIEAYSEKQFNISLKDLLQMKNLTKGAFKSGSRKSTENDQLDKKSLSKKKRRGERDALSGEPLQVVWRSHLPLRD